MGTFFLWRSRLRSSFSYSRPNVRNLRTQTTRNSATTTSKVIGSESRKKTKPFLLSLLSFPLAVSARLLSFHFQSQPSFCDASNLDPRSEEEVSNVVKCCNKHKLGLSKLDHGTAKKVYVKNVCVPLSQLAELDASKSKRELDASPLICTVIAHADDGNFHTVALFYPENEEHRHEAERLNQFMVYTALSMQGTCTGEHGVGTGKMKNLERELGVEALKTMKRIKVALDPNNIMNPGKIDKREIAPDTTYC